MNKGRANWPRSMESRTIRLITQERLPTNMEAPTRETAIENLRDLGVWGSFKGIELESVKKVKTDRKDHTTLYDLTWVGERRVISGLTKEYFDLLAAEGE